MSKCWSIRFMAIPTNRSACHIPLDMMRRDRCTPFSQDDASELVCIDIEDYEVKPITFVHYAHGNKTWKPNFDRWRSFGWRVIHVGMPQEV